LFFQSSPERCQPKYANRAAEELSALLLFFLFMFIPSVIFSANKSTAPFKRIEFVKIRLEFSDKKISVNIYAQIHVQPRKSERTKHLGSIQHINERRGQ
jgi:hypothetical protein